MDSCTEGCGSNYDTPLSKRLKLCSPSASDFGSQRRKWIQLNEGKEYSSKGFYECVSNEFEKKVNGYSATFGVPDLLKGLDSGKFGSVTQEIEELLARRTQMLKPFYSMHPTLQYMNFDVDKDDSKDFPEAYWLATPSADDVINLENEKGAKVVVPAARPVSEVGPLVILDSDDEDPGDQSHFLPLPEEVLKKPAGDFLMKDVKVSFEDPGDQMPFCPLQEEGVLKMPSGEDLMKDVKDAAPDPSPDGPPSEEVLKKPAGDFLMKDVKVSLEDPGDKMPFCPLKDEGVLKKPSGEDLMKDVKDGECAESHLREDASILAEINFCKDKGVYVGVDDDMGMGNSYAQSDSSYDGLVDIWNEMTFALECSKDAALDPSPDESPSEGEDECDHSFILKEDIGYVCRICGFIQRGIETIFEFQYSKGTRSTRTYRYEARDSRDKDPTGILSGGIKTGHDFSVAEIHAHPRHMKQMKPHQIEGFNFLLSNLVTDNPGGCILAHAPGSGKTFMIICFMQSFMAKYPSAKPLVVLPRGILPTWKKEFQRWQVENLPLYDLYSAKADSRSQQLEVLKQWVRERSILFLGYKQLSSIVCDSDTSKATTACQEILLHCPSLLILDEGHTPRNQDTDVLTSLEKIQTPRKVVLSGTLYQNHVKEVFTILNLVRPKFLRLETSKSIKKRILSRVPISRGRSLFSVSDNDFYDLVEHTLTREEEYKVTVIQDLREMTNKVLHYYKGDFLDDLPGLVDFTVFLKLSPMQKREVAELKKLGRKFKISSDGSAIYVHPELKYLPKNAATRDKVDEDKIDEMLEKVDVNEGVKAKFFLNLLRLCDSCGEKLLVFGQYLLPLKFLERLAAKVKGWSLGREIFVITGDSDNDARESSVDKFNKSPDARVFFGSIKACGEGISLVGASRIIILDVPLNPSVTRQAIGRAFRPGQEKKVHTYRLVAAGSPEAEDHLTSFRKETIAKLWFEWNACRGHQDFVMETVDVKECGDSFLETPRLSEDVDALQKR